MNTQTQAEALGPFAYGMSVMRMAREMYEQHGHRPHKIQAVVMFQCIEEMAARIAELEAQAQPAREPTTEKHLMELADSLGYEPLNPARVDFMYGYRKAEAACGITKEKP